MSCIWVLVHLSVEHVPKSSKCQFTKYGRLTTRDPKEGVKTILKLFFVTLKQILRKKKTKSTIKEIKTAKMTYFWFLVHWLAEHVPKSAIYQFSKSGQLTEERLSEGAKIILKLRFLTQRWVLRKNQGGLSNREKQRECLIIDSGCIGWQSTRQNMPNINSPN